MRTKLIASLMVSLLLLSGCAKQVFYVDGSPELELGDPTAEGRKYFFVDGVAQKDTRNAAEICGSAANVIAVEAHQTGLDVLISYVTFSIVTPRTYRVYCKS